MLLLMRDPKEEALKDLVTSLTDPEMMTVVVVPKMGHPKTQVPKTEDPKTLLCQRKEDQRMALC